MLRIPEGIEKGPQSEQFSNEGIDWLDHRINLNQFAGAMTRYMEQKYLKELGETQRLSDVSIAQSRHFGSDAKEVPLRTVRYEKRGDPFSREVVGDTPTHLFRGMSEEDFQASKKRGYIQSDGRGAIFPDWEGTNAAIHPGTAHVYLPNQGAGRIVKMRVDPNDGWFGNKYDSYARTRQQIPWDRVKAFTSPIDKSQPVVSGERPSPGDGMYDADGKYIGK